ncbi:hypothetical protein WJX72_007814 [[Myrmecia] bisecta]|uniref:Fatty acid desaturase domain-containing protein n=1 Tax=[Myrmecia] bisecta TaxID=41462 RepID=A0AAW1QFK7_9CHLO
MHVIIPAAVALFCARPSSILGALYLALNYGLFLQRFLLALHFSEHRRLFQPAYGVLNKVIPMLLAPLFGVPSGMYRLHHCIMHHAEDNLHPYDVSSTEPYNRGSFRQFLRYWLRFLVAIWLELPLYAFRRKRYARLAECLAVICGYSLVVRWLWCINSSATIWALLVPHVVTSFALMIGNWSQHIFIDGRWPGSPYHFTYTCVNCPDNQRSFNDGYHVVHHLNSKLHWSELPLRFIATIDQHACENALVFENIGFFDIGVAVFTRRFGFLVDNLRPLNTKTAQMSRSEAISWLQSLLHPVSREMRDVKRH